MCSDFVTAGTLGGIRGSLRRVANDLEQQNRTVSALAQQTQVANHWQVTASSSRTSGLSGKHYIGER